MPRTQPLTIEGDLSAQMVAGIDKFLMQETERSKNERPKHWQRNFASPQEYQNSVEPNRNRLRQILGVVDQRLPPKGLEFVGGVAEPAKVAETDSYIVYAVRWPVFEGVFGEGLWLKQKQTPLAQVIAIPDADQTPEMITGLAPGVAAERQFGRRLAENGCEVLVPTLVDRSDTWSGNAFVKRYSNQPHREWIYRQAYELGRHIIGYEVQKVLAAVDLFEHGRTNVPPGAGGRPMAIGVAGYAEGGLLAFYAAALDKRINAALVSGYFDSRQQLWEEPIYRNVFGLLEEFGDAEIASLIAPRTLIIEQSAVPKITGPPKPREGRSGAAPGKLSTPDFESVQREVGRAQTLVKGLRDFDSIKFVFGNEGMATGPGSENALESFMVLSGLRSYKLKPSGPAAHDLRQHFDPAERQQRQVTALDDFTQKLLRQAESVRAQFFWSQMKVGTLEEWTAAREGFKTNFWDEVIGRVPAPTMPMNPRSRPIETASKNWTCHEVVLDVCQDVFAWGYLLVPNDLKPGERRPVVVCQHGLEGVPADTINEDTNSQAFRYYKAFAGRLADRGFITFAPHNPYRGQERFRVLQRKANPLKKSLFSIIIAQHGRILDWLSEQPFVDPKRIGFYGLSYGGKTAMRVPAVLDRYALSICSGDFNEWIRKNVMTDYSGSYMASGEYEMPEFNLGMTFNYAEMAALIAPRPFMVERGHNDGVGIDEWVSYEYAKVRRLYDGLNIRDRTQIEFFNGPHTINGQGTFEFLEKHLGWEKR